MAHTIIQHVVQPSGASSVQVPQGSTVLGAGRDVYGRPVAFFLVDLARPAVWRRLHTAETAEVLPDAIAPAMYRGSVTTPHGAVVHLFDLGER